MTAIASIPWIKQDLGANHFMWTTATLHDNGWITGQTRTATFTWFGGYRGTMSVVAFNPQGIVLAKTPPQTYGVDGTWVGRSDRTDAWSFNVGVGAVQPGVYLQAAQWWAGISLDDVIKVGQRVAAAFAIIF